jgi:hypothetical protein
MTPPDYENSNIVNLMASIVAALGGGETVYRSLSELPPERLAERTLVLFVVDGLGDEFLTRFPHSCLYRHRIATLTTVFPSTTASAITSFATGLAPQQHGITGWFTYLRELGSIATILPFRPRHGGPVYSKQTGVKPHDLTRNPSISARISVVSDAVAPKDIVHSEYNQYACGKATRYGYQTLGELFGTVTELLKQAHPRYVYVYWPELDSLAHRYGIDKRPVSDRVLQFDKAFQQFLERIKGHGATVLLTSDHGHINTFPTTRIRLEAHPALQDTLVLPLCGESRVPFCYVRSGKQAQFESYVDDELSEYCDRVRSEELVEAGYFGLGQPHPRLCDRIGDYILLMKDHHTLRDQLPGEDPFDAVGVHGGLSPSEMFVPLIAIET